METWRKVTLPISECEPGRRATDLQDAFYTVFVAYGSPANAAMFKDTDNDLSKCYFYFSPGAVKIAGTLINSYGGAACERPPRNAAFIVGDADARQSLLR